MADMIQPNDEPVLDQREHRLQDRSDELRVRVSFFAEPVLQDRRAEQAVLYAVHRRSGRAVQL